MQTGSCGWGNCDEETAAGYTVLLVCLALAHMLSGCKRTDDALVPDASVLASGNYPGGHFALQADNSLRMLLDFTTGELAADASLGSWQSYGSRPRMRPDQNLRADHELLAGPEDWLATCRRDGYLEVWRDGNPDEAFWRIEELYTPLPLWPGSQYPVTDSCRLLEEQVLVTARDQSLVSFDYGGDEQWRFLMGAPARLLLDDQNQQILLASMDGNLYCLNLQGELLWQQPSGGQQADLLPDGRIVHSGLEGGIHCLDAVGKLLWDYGNDQQIDELRYSGGRIWFATAGRPGCLDIDGTALELDWPEELELRDLVCGLSGEVFLSGFPHPDSIQAQTAAGGLPVAASGWLLCFDEQGRRLWAYDVLLPTAAIIPAHERQCWLISFQDSGGGNSLLRIGLPLSSQGA
ncbi:MAG: PQQ-binding-like beta-propeller repeat protein [bacterium]